MAETGKPPSGPDLTQGIAASEVLDGAMIAGHVGDEAVLLARVGAEFLAVGGTCTHYGGPLAEGLLVGDQVRCPWHHACFSLRSGEALRAPAIDAIARWRVDVDGNTVFVREKIEGPTPVIRLESTATPEPERIVIVGGGAAGFAAAEMLRRRGYAGSLVMLSDDTDPPADRPNLSKDYLAGKAPEDWIPLRPPGFYEAHRIDLRLGARVTAIRPDAREVELEDGPVIPYDRLLLATGAEPLRLNLPGSHLPHVYTLRTVRDCRAIIAAAEQAQSAAVIGASFIGLEVAASLRTRGVPVTVIAPEEIPMARVLGPELGEFVRKLHEERGVAFRLKNTVVEILETSVHLEDGSILEADLVVMGVGVRPRTALAEAAGLAVDNGVLVDRYLETSAPGIFAAGDIARWPDPRAGERIRIEHWVVAERQGQCAALNMLGASQAFELVPFFWSQHYDVPINYVGYARSWQKEEIDGSIPDRDCLVDYRREDKTLAVSSIYRDRASLEAELAMEREV